MSMLKLSLVAGGSLVIGWALGSVLPWWGTALLVLGALAYVRIRVRGRT